MPDIKDTQPQTSAAHAVPAGADPDFVKRLDNHQLTTAEILYHLPDYPSILQSYIWQELDVAPKFPALRGFLRFWQMKLEGKLYRVRVCSSALIKPAELNARDGEFLLN